MIGLSFADRSSVAILDPAPTGDTTEEDTRAPSSTVLIDERLRFGAFGSKVDPVGGVEFSFWMPGGVATGERPRLRYNPLRSGFTQDYQLALRFGSGKSAPNSPDRRGVGGSPCSSRKPRCSI
ncbi:MAG: hypothetical protein ACRYG4_13400 [Janthinobacterium lividum]